SSGIENRDATPSMPRRPCRRRDLPTKRWARVAQLRRRSSEAPEHSRSRWETTEPPPPQRRSKARLAPLALALTDLLRPKSRPPEHRPLQGIRRYEPAAFPASAGQRTGLDGQALSRLPRDRPRPARVRATRQADRARERQAAYVSLRPNGQARPPQPR